MKMNIKKYLKNRFVIIFTTNYFQLALVYYAIQIKNAEQPLPLQKKKKLLLENRKNVFCLQKESEVFFFLLFNLYFKN